MKKLSLVLTVAIGIMTQSAFAGHQDSKVFVRFENNDPIVVWVDGYKTGAASSVQRISDLPCGNHHFKIYKIRRTSCGQTFGRKLIFDRVVRIPKNQIIHAVINRNFGYRVERRIALNGRPGGCSHGCAGVCTHHGHGHGVSVPVCGHSGCNSGGCTFGQNAGFGMSVGQFAHLKGMINQQNFESSKLSIAKQAISRNYVTSRQVRKLLELLYFESTRVELAKFAFEHTVDKENYYIVHDAFTFGSSIHELEDYLAMY